MKNWTSDTQRADGVTIEPWDGGYEIVAPKSNTRMRLCPCCDCAMATKQAAQLVADVAFPIWQEPPRQ